MKLLGRKLILRGVEDVLSEVRLDGFLLNAISKTCLVDKRASIGTLLRMLREQ